MRNKSFKLFVSLLLATLLWATSCTSYKGVPYLQNSDEVSLTSSAYLYDARILPKDELTIIVSCPEDPEAVTPFNLTTPRVYGQTSTLSITSQPALQTYLVNNEGIINFPVLGDMYVQDKTVSQVENEIASAIQGNYLKTRPVVTVRLSNYKISVLGEVTSPGSFTISSEKINIYEALALAKDMTIWGRRDNVKLIREDEKGEKSIYEFNLNDADIINSPFFYLQQNDVLYVTPNRTKSKNSDIGSSTTYWVSATSILISVASLVVNICNN